MIANSNRGIAATGQSSFALFIVSVGVIRASVCCRFDPGNGAGSSVRRDDADITGEEESYMYDGPTLRGVAPEWWGARTESVAL